MHNILLFPRDLRGGMVVTCGETLRDPARPAGR
nr:MAG TPA: hypothetical protein [Caudoviricetes sp.]